MVVCRAKRQYLLTCKVSRYCFMALYLTMVYLRAASIAIVTTHAKYTPLVSLQSFFVLLKVKVKVYSLISSLKTYHPTLHLTPWSLDLFIRVPFQLHGEHTVLQPFLRIELIVHIAISVLPDTYFHLSQLKHLRVECLAQGHNILTMSQD